MHADGADHGAGGAERRVDSRVAAVTTGPHSRTGGMTGVGGGFGGLRWMQVGNLTRHWLSIPDNGLVRPRQLRRSRSAATTPFAL